MDKLKRVWKTPIWLPYLNPELTDEMVLEAEKKICHKLPNEYIELLKIQNGGYIRLKNKVNDYAPHDVIEGIGSQFPSILDADLSNIDDPFTELDGLVHFDGDGHWYLCLDYRLNKTEPQITYLDVECEEEAVLYESFAEYLQALEFSEEDLNEHFVLETDDSINKVITKIENILKIKFTESSDEAFYHRDKDHDIDLIIYLNKVVRGHFSSEDKFFEHQYKQRYEELKSYTKEMGLAYPEIPENSIVLHIPNGEETIEKLSQNNISLTDLKKYVI
jgi:hypothetical protein